MNCFTILFQFFVVYFCTFLENIEETSRRNIDFYFIFYIKFTTFKLKTITFIILIKHIKTRIGKPYILIVYKVETYIRYIVIIDFLCFLNINRTIYILDFFSIFGAQL